ncbi:BrnT family toxin [Rugamonas rivuli]|uniref:BrnT family toxin n=1 Tax=Rugamonas rivuli TaxID=2743358 RepID=A0A843SAE4_9BURK|nr:BrnT family toxin [Rugamonas rivuli]
MRFEWDARKAKTNLRKHGVSFDEAVSAFHDGRSRSLADVEHSGDEERFIQIGASDRGRLLTVCYCYRDNDVIRIFSARKANSLEAQLYFWE